MVVNPAVFENDPDSLATKPAGSGPSCSTSYVQNANAALTRNPKYFEADEIEVAGFELYPAAHAATVVASLQSGQYNVGLLPGSQVDAAKAAGLEVQVIPSLYVATLDVNTTMKPFDDPEVVEALHYAVDRQPLLETASSASARSNYQPFPPGLRRPQRGARGRLRLRPRQGQAAPRGRRLRQAGPGHDLHRRTPRASPSCCSPSSRPSASSAKIETIPQRPVHPAGLHPARQGAGRRRVRRP